MHDLVKNERERILSIIKSKGPSLPVQIAKEINVSPLFAAAFLAELKSSGALKVTNMKVGNSPLYYLPGQEELLEKFIEHLNPREREAFSLLKREVILDDGVQSPVTRVALRAIKDFAVPIRVRINEDIRFFWKYFLLPDSEIKAKIERRLLSVEKHEDRKDNIKDENAITAKAEERVEKIKEEPVVKEVKSEKKKKSVKAKEHTFSKNVKEYIVSKDMEILEVISEKKKEFIVKIRIDTLLGKQEVLLVAKDKKIITDNDLSSVLQRAQAEKMPAIFISIGELNKKGKEYLKEWRNLIRFDKLNF